MIRRHVSIDHHNIADCCIIGKITGGTPCGTAQPGRNGSDPSVFGCDHRQCIDLELTSPGLSAASPMTSVVDLTSTDRPWPADPLLRIDDVLYPERIRNRLGFSGVVMDKGPVSRIALEVRGEPVYVAEVPAIPAWVSVLPPLVAIGMALLIRSVLPALMLGLWLGAWALEGLSLKGFFVGLFTSFESMYQRRCRCRSRHHHALYLHDCRHGGCHFAKRRDARHRRVDYHRRQ